MAHTSKTWILSAALVVTSSGAQAQCETGSLTAPGGVPLEGFARALARDGERLLVAAPFDSEVVAAGGAAHVFERTGGTWSHTAKLIPSGLAPQVASANDVALLGDTAFVGCYQCTADDFIDGGVYVFEHDGTVWTETDFLRQSQPGKFAQFGSALAAQGDTLVVGALGETTSSYMEGAAYVFALQDGQWLEVQRLTASDGTSQDEFGYSVALDGDRLLVGARHGPSPGGAATGSVYVFEELSGVWTETARLWGAGTVNFDGFGTAVALDGDVAVSSAPFGSLGGRAFVHELGPSGWSETAVLESDAARLGNYGLGVDVDGDRLALTDLTILPEWETHVRVFEREDGPWEEVYDLFSGTIAGGTIAGGDLGFALELDGQELAVAADRTGPGAVALLALPPIVTLAGAPARLSLWTGGSQSLELRAGSCHAAQLYLVLGSLTGTSPGIALEGGTSDFVLPLTLDAYTAFTLASPNAPPLVATVGVLDASGAATAGFVLPAGTDPALSGLALHHAAVVFDATTMAVEFVSDAATVTLQP